MTILESLLHLFSMDVLLLVALAIVLGAIVVARRVHWLPERRALSGSARGGNRVTHIAEAIVLLCVATAIFVFTATNTSTGGRLLILDQLRPGFAATNVMVAVAAAAGVLIGVLAALLWRTSAGVIFSAGVLCLYGLMLNGPKVLLDSLAPKGTIKPDTSLTFILGTPDATGAELYVNDVRLATLPYETTLDEFYKNVPFWKDEPNELRSKDPGSWLTVPNQQDYLLNGGQVGRIYRLWGRLDMPDRRSTRNWEHRWSERTYYVRVKLDGEWGYATGNNGGHISGSGRYGRDVGTMYLGYIFPDRQKRIEKLLDIARLHDYAPGPAWFETMETYRSDGWLAVRKAMDDEPRMAEILDRWAAWKYDLDAVTDAESAWKVFERIRAEADRRGYYQTSDIAGRAVEWLAPRLDPERLIRLARSIIRSIRFYNWIAWQMNGRTQFGMSVIPGGLHTGANETAGAVVGHLGERPSPGDYAVAHAVWRLDKTSEARGDTGPNIVERELVPVFVAQNYDNMTLLGIAVHVGGPAIERYLLRQNWQARPEELPFRQQMHAFGDSVNGWLDLLANLPSPAGREFRREHEHLLMELADPLAAHLDLYSWDRDFKFLFLDLDRGSDSLAMKYWPRFEEAAAAEKRDALSLQYQYLIRMEPLSTVDMYVQCWKEYRGDWNDFCLALNAFTKASVPYSKRQQICAGLVDYVRKDISNVTSAVPIQDDLRDRLISSLISNLTPITEEARADDFFAEIQAGSSKYTRENIAAWLAHSRPGHPLVRMLADANEPSLRLLVMGALREYPTPANRAILEKLLHDKNKQVCEAAEAVAADLTALEETPVARFADTEVGPTAR